MKNVFTTILLISLTFIFADMLEDGKVEFRPARDHNVFYVNHPTISTNNFDTISGAVNATNNLNDTASCEIQVYPDFISGEAVYTIFSETFTIPSRKTLLSAYLDETNPGRGLVEISSNNTLITVPYSEQTENDDKEVVIENFIFKSENREEIQNGDLPAIAVGHRKFALLNCEFGKRTESKHFPKLVQCESLFHKGTGASYYFHDNDFSDSSDWRNYAINHYTLYPDNTNKPPLCFAWLGFLDNNFDNCGSSIYSENHDTLICNYSSFKNEDNGNVSEANAIRAISSYQPVTLLPGNYFTANNFQNFSTTIESQMDINGHLYAKGNNLINVDTGFKSNYYAESLYYYNLIKIAEHNLDNDNFGIFNSGYNINFVKNTIYSEILTATGIQVDNRILGEQCFDNIVWGFGTSFNFTNPAVSNETITYSCFDGSITGINDDTTTNVYSDPMFVDVNNNDFHLLEGSPCIDAGSPDFNVNGVSYEPGYDLQEFGSIMEIGKYDVAETENTEVKHLFPNKAGYICFPRLDRSDSYDNCSVQIQNVFEEGDHQYIFKFLEGTSEYNHQQGWIQEGNRNIKTSTGMSCEIGGDDVLSIAVEGIVLDEDTPITFNQPQHRAWVGYWKPGKASDLIMCDILLDNIWNRVMTIKAEDWYFQRGDLRNGSIAVKPSNKIHPFQYGKSYKITFDQPISGFTYNYDEGDDSRDKSSPAKKVEFYDIDYKSDYEVIDVMDIPESVEEIGVFENDVCVGAVSVDEKDEQILVYSEQTNRDSSPFVLEFYDGSRSSKATSYLTWDENVGAYIDKPVYSNQKEYHLITLNKNQVTDANFRLQVNQSYPNPFNLSNNSRSKTTISYFVSETTDVKVSIYNVRGQKITTLYDGEALAGKHQVQWSGTNSANKKVASGVYFYQVKANSKVSTGKMLIIK